MGRNASDSNFALFPISIDCFAIRAFQRALFTCLFLEEEVYFWGIASEIKYLVYKAKDQILVKLAPPRAMRTVWSRNGRLVQMFRNFAITQMSTECRQCLIEALISAGTIEYSDR